MMMIRLDGVITGVRLEGSLPLGRARRRRGVRVDGVPGHAVSPSFVLLLVASQASD